MLEAVDGGEERSAALIEAADRHLLAGEVIAGQVDLQARIAGVGRAGKAGDDFLQRIERLACQRLIALHVGLGSPFGGGPSQMFSAIQSLTHFFDDIHADFGEFVQRG